MGFFDKMEDVTYVSDVKWQRVYTFSKTYMNTWVQESY